MEIAVYAAEREAGIADLVRSSAAVAYCSPLELAEVSGLSEWAIARINSAGKQRAKASETGSFDLHHLKSLLATTTWNKNDDVFLAEPTWNARSTAEDKPFNYGHQCNDIIGHITSSYAVDDEGATIADTTAVDELPAKFHIVTGAVLYKTWADDVLQERMDRILAEIAENKWFVSMESLFSGFDYAVKADDGTCEIVGRSQATAFLTKHLRAYGGKGIYNGQKLGRVLRNFVFSGKGLVAKPANPESIIFPEESEPVVLATGEILSSFPRESQKEVYVIREVTTDTQERTITMATEVELTARLEEQTKTIKALEKTIADQNVAGVQAELAKATAAYQAKTDELAAAAAARQKAEAELKAQNELAAKSDTAFAELRVAHEKATAELSGIKAEQKKVSRIALVKATLKVEDKDEKAVAAAVEMAESLADVSDENFAKHLQAVAKFTPAQVPPKATPAPLPSKATPAPLGKDSTVEKSAAAEVDAAEGAADTSALEGATAGEITPAIHVPVTDDGVNEVQRSIAAYFGCGDAE